MTGGDQESANPELDATVREMKRIRDGCEYYAVKLTANRRNHMTFSSQTEWVGWSSRRKGWEIRQASRVEPTLMAELWTRIGRSWVSVHDRRHILIFLQIGGNALVERTCTEQWIPDVIGPKEYVHDGDIRVNGAGFLATDHLPDDAVTRKAPTRSLRMQVLKRDNYRCVICGQSPQNNVHVELEVHHVIPWRMGGPTAEEHLATLCGACHDGLDPDYEPKIRELANLPAPSDPLRGSEFHEEVQRYRALVPTFWPKLAASEPQ